MLYYKIEDIDENINKSGDYNYMLNLVMEDYTNYNKASIYLQSRYDFCLQSIYSCLSKVNNMENKSNAYKELSRFLQQVKEKSGLYMEIINKKNKLSVKEKPKMKIKRHYYRAS